MEREFKFTFTAKDVDIIAGGLGKLPLEVSQTVFNNLVQQYQAQIPTSPPKEVVKAK